MTCGTCGHENRGAARFCGGCGGSLVQEIRCPHCDSVNPAGGRFCDGCGQALSGAPSAAADTPSAPEAFGSGRYTVQRFLGEGGKKRVFLAHDTRLSRDVAIAVIKTEGLDDGGRARVRREAEAMGQLGDHPNIVTVYDVAEENGQVYLVTQYMSGGDLEARLQAADERRLPIDEALRVAGEIASALAHAHARGVIHRDLKPGNVWLAGDGSSQLGDFGLALTLDHSRITQEGMMVGTVAYMPPEQALGRTPDGRSDLYALGVTLYEMVAGRPPFVGDDAVAVISQHINTPPVAPSWHNAAVSKALEGVILDLLAKDPASRPADAGLVRERLEAVSSAPAAAAPSVVQEAANPLDRLASGVFVGREHEVEQLRAGLDGALSGRARILMLVGEPGIGKTRTSEELTTYAGLRGAQVLWGRCYEGEGAPAYWPWVQIIRAYANDTDPQTLMSEMGPAAADIAEVVSDVRARLPGLPASAALDPEQTRFRLFDGVVSFLRNAAARQPLVLVLDDLHWADKPSLLLLQFLARELGPQRLFVLGTYRDVELRRQHPLSETLAELARNQLAERIVLRGLSEADVSSFIGATAGIDPPPALIQAVFRETEGNPFFVHEVVRLLAQDGRLERPEEVESWSLEIPQGVREVVGRRLNQLSEDCNRVLTIGSVIGRDFELGVLERVSDLSEDRILETLDEALAGRVVVEAPDAFGRYRFAHALVRETLYEELSTPRRVRLHRRVGDVLETLYGERAGSHLAEISHHRFQAVQAGDVGRAIDASVRAGEWSVAHVAYEDAAEHYERAVQALELDERPDRDRLCELLVVLAELRVLAGETAQARETSLRALEAARERGAGELLARGVLAYGGSFPVIEMGRIDETMLTMLEGALAALGAGDSALRVRLLCRLSNELFFGRDPKVWERRESLCEEAVEMARRLDDPGAIIEALRIMSRAGNLAEPRNWLAEGDEILRLAEQIGDPERALWGLSSRVVAYLTLGDGENLDVAIEAHDRSAEAVRTSTSRYFPIAYRAMRLIVRGQFEEGERLAREALGLGLRAYEQNAVQWLACQLGPVRELQGRLRPGSQLKLWVERFPAYPIYRASLARAHMAVDARDAARRELEVLAREGFETVPRDGNWLPTLCQSAEVAVYLADMPSAAQIYEVLRPASELHSFYGAGIAYQGPVSTRLGMLAAQLGQLGDAEQHFEQALRGTEALDARPWFAQAQYELARMLLTRLGPGDRERALELLNLALATAQELGLQLIVQGALAVKLETQGIDSGTHAINRSLDIVAASIGDKRPDLSHHAAPDGTVTLMFSDMEGFTAMTERLGDLQAREVIREHNRVVREQLAAHGGYEVELQGDGFLLAFGSARRALYCAIAIQRAFAVRNASAEEPIHVRIGLHTGEALRDADKFFGKTVIMAARIAGQAKAQQILVSSLLRDLTQSVGDLSFGAAREVGLKGISDRQRVVEVDWA